MPDDVEEITRSSPEELTAESGVPRIRIVLDPGHGGPGTTDEQELGAKYRDTFEKDLTLKIAQAAGAELSAYGNVYLPAAYGAIVGFFFLGMALLAIGMYISSVTESQAVAAGLCFVVMLVNYFLSDLAGFASSTAYSSLAALALTALIVCGIVYLMTKNGFVSLILAAVLEAGLIGGYLWDSSRFEGLFPQIISQLSLFARFYTIVNGVFDVTAIVYYLSVTGFFLFLSVQSLEKRRWSE